MNKIGLELKITPELLKKIKVEENKDTLHAVGRMLVDTLSPHFPPDGTVILTLTAESE